MYTSRVILYKSILHEVHVIGSTMYEYMTMSVRSAHACSNMRLHRYNALQVRERGSWSSKTVENTPNLQCMLALNIHDWFGQFGFVFGLLSRNLHKSLKCLVRWVNKITLSFSLSLYAPNWLSNVNLLIELGKKFF